MQKNAFVLWQKILILPKINLTISIMRKVLLLLCACILSLSCNKNSSYINPTDSCGDNTIRLLLEDKKLCSNGFYEFQKVDIVKKKFDVFIWYSEDGIYNIEKQMYYLHITGDYHLNTEEILRQVRFGDAKKNIEHETGSGKFTITNESNDSISGDFSITVKMPGATRNLSIEGKINKLKNR